MTKLNARDAQHRLPLGHLPPTDDFIDTVVDVIVDGIRRDLTAPRGA